MTLLSFDAPGTRPAVRPDGVAAVRRSGRRPHRLLMFGGGALQGLGLRDHDLGVPGRVADALVARSGRGVDLDVVVDPDPTSPRAMDGLRGLRLRRYDAVVVVLGDLPARAGLRHEEWCGQVERLSRLLHEETSSEVPVLLCDSGQPMLAAHPVQVGARRTTAIAQSLTAASAEIAATAGVGHVELVVGAGGTLPGGVFSSATYTIWADLIASRIYPKLYALELSRSSDTPAEFRSRPDPERPRQRALGQLRLRPGSRNERLDFIVRQARAIFLTDAAHLNVIDGDLQWPHASTAAEPFTTPRRLAICDHTIRADGLTLVNDTRCDPRFADNPLVEAEGGARFYAGFPIHSWDGYRVGSLCVVDRVPRSMLPSQLRPLQDLAGQVERELWTAALRRERRA